MEERLIATVAGGVATVTLNRPTALNALSFEMLRALDARLDVWESDPAVRVVVLRGAGNKAFCAGGDLRALHAMLASGRDEHHEFFRFEYALDHRIHHYSKAIVAILDGIVMGGGMGISQGASLRIVGERTRMAMPETAIGLFPDVGGSYFLSRTPGAIGNYLGLAGPTLNAADAIYARLADTSLPVDGPHPESELARQRPAIDRHFSQPTALEIVASLESETDAAHRDWALSTAALLRKRSPLLLEVTVEQLRRGATMNLADCFRMELNMIHACFDQGDMMEGIRALIVDKDNNPRWNPPRLEEVSRTSVEKFFAPRWSTASHPLASLKDPA